MTSFAPLAVLALQVMDFASAASTGLIGLGILAMLKKQAAAKQAAVSRGEKTSDQAAKEMRLLRGCGWALAVLGLIQAALVVLRHRG